MTMSERSLVRLTDREVAFITIGLMHLGTTYDPGSDDWEVFEDTRALVERLEGAELWFRPPQ